MIPSAVERCGGCQPIFLTKIGLTTLFGGMTTVTLITGIVDYTQGDIASGTVFMVASTVSGLAIGLFWKCLPEKMFEQTVDSLSHEVENLTLLMDTNQQEGQRLAKVIDILSKTPRNENLSALVDILKKEFENDQKELQELKTTNQEIRLQKEELAEQIQSFRLLLEQLGQKESTIGEMTTSFLEQLGILGERKKEAVLSMEEGKEAEESFQEKIQLVEDTKTSIEQLVSELATKMASKQDRLIQLEQENQTFAKLQNQLSEHVDDVEDVAQFLDQKIARLQTLNQEVAAQNKALEETIDTIKAKKGYKQHLATLRQEREAWRQEKAEIEQLRQELQTLIQNNK